MDGDSGHQQALVSCRWRSAGVMMGLDGLGIAAALLVRITIGAGPLSWPQDSAVVGGSVGALSAFSVALSSASAGSSRALDAV